MAEPKIFDPLRVSALVAGFNLKLFIMKFRALAMMALAFASFDKNVQEQLKETNSFKKSLEGTYYSNVNVGNNPIYIPSKSQKIKRARFLARKK